MSVESIRDGVLGTSWYTRPSGQASEWQVEAQLTLVMARGRGVRERATIDSGGETPPGQPAGRRRYLMPPLHNLALRTTKRHIACLRGGPWGRRLCSSRLFETPGDWRAGR